MNPNYGPLKYTFSSKIYIFYLKSTVWSSRDCKNSFLVQNFDNIYPRIYPSISPKIFNIIFDENFALKSYVGKNKKKNGNQILDFLKSQNLIRHNLFHNLF